MQSEAPPLSEPTPLIATPQKPPLSNSHPIDLQQRDTQGVSARNSIPSFLQGDYFSPGRQNPTLKSSTDNIHLNSSSCARAHVYDPPPIEEKKKPENIAAKINKRYAELFGNYAPQSEILTFSISFLDNCGSGKEEEERLIKKIFNDMQWVAERPHLRKYVRSLNFVWHMTRFREREKTMIRRTKPCVDDLIKGGKSPKEALIALASGMSLDKEAFYEWGRRNIILDLVKE